MPWFLPGKRPDRVPLLLGTHVLNHTTGPELKQMIGEILQDGGRILVDLDGVERVKDSSLLTLVAALDEAGGWPRARLVLLGGGPALVRTLDSLDVSRFVPHAKSFPEALTKLLVRPEQVRRRMVLPPRAESVRRAQAELDDACCGWGLPVSSLQTARLALGELVANVIEHAATDCSVVVEYDGTRLWLAVSDYSNKVLRLHRGSWPIRGKGLQNVAVFSDRWGVEYLSRTKTVWACVTPDRCQANGALGGNYRGHGVERPARRAGRSASR